MLVKNVFQIFLCDPEYLEYNLTERAEVFEKSRSHFVKDYSNYNYKIYFNEELEQEILDFDSELYQVYSHIVPYAYRTDIGRYVLLYKYGGWYFDLNTKPNFYIEPKKDILIWNSSNSQSGHLIENRIIYSKPHKKLFSDSLQSIIKNYKEIHHGQDALFVTGPGLLKQNFDRLDDLEKNQIELHCFDFVTSEFKYKDCVFNLHKNAPLVQEPTGLDYLDLKGVNNYAPLYRSKNVYRYTISTKKTLKKKNVGLSLKIPQIIHQTFKTDIVPSSIKRSITSWIDLNPEYEHRFYDDKDIRNYIKNFDCTEFNFSSDELLSAFDSIFPGAGKADIFRYCVIYQEGGVYADADSICLVSLNDIIEKDTSILTIMNAWYKDQGYHIFSQWFLAYEPKNEIIKKVLNSVISGILYKNPTKKWYKNLPDWDSVTLENYTGSIVYNSILLDEMNLKNKIPVIEHIKEGNIKFSSHNLKIIHYTYDQNQKLKFNRSEMTEANLSKNNIKAKYVMFKNDFENNFREWFEQPIFNHD